MLNVKSKAEFHVHPDWLAAAVNLSGGATAKLAVLILSIGQQQGRRSIELKQPRLEEAGIERTTAYRALKVLGDAGLIRIRQYERSSPNIEIVDHHLNLADI